MYLKTIINSASALLFTTVMTGCDVSFTDEEAALLANKLGFVFVAESSVSVPENSTVVTTLNTTGGDLPIVYEISAGSDKERFSVDPESGVLTFNGAADYEAPADANRDNVYSVTVTAMDNSGKRTRLALNVTVDDIDETRSNGENAVAEAEEHSDAEELSVSETSPAVAETPVPKESTAVEETPTANETPVSEENPVAEERPICIAGDAMLSGQVKDSSSGAGVANVRVSVGGCSTSTDANGNFTLANIAETEKAVVDFNHENYLRSSTVVQIDRYSEGTTSASPNYLEYAIDAYDHQWSYDSQSRASGAHINLPASVYSDKAGNAYQGTVTAGLEIVDVTTDKGKSLFPGSFEGKNSSGETVLFGSYGLISLSLKDASGNELELSEGATASLTFDAVATLKEQNIIPLWYYDYEQGVWIEEGYAELQPDGTYKGDVSHIGTWSLNVPLESAPGIYRGRIVYTDGITAKDARVTLIGPNWVRSDLSTDADGIFEIEVLPGDDFQLTAYNYKWKYGAKYDGTLSAVASGAIVEERM